VKDKTFIKEMLRKGEEAGEKVNTAFAQLSYNQLDWKPSPGNWSIGQCLDHLIITNCQYFPVLKKITTRQYTMNPWEKWSPFSGLFGKVLLNAVEEKQVRKIKTAKIFRPPETNIDAVIFERFNKHLDSLLGYISACEELDVDRTRISSPVSKLVTYSLRKALLIITEHLHRHINQAMRVRSSKEFPTI
jgi:hypothetical protein